MLARDERGQAVPLALVVVAVAILATVAIAELGGNVVDAGRARTAADAAALAGVEGGREASATVAAENGATLVSWSSRPDGDGSTVTVTVRVGRARASAAASNRGP
jgi:Putative Flp pilus-assembly TadE/G-like